eukprot:m.74600 g.74600  ORF g.74600 m.74600 type:complete len:145 (-) comp12403_c0_seq2:149-583(-)
MRHALTCCVYLFALLHVVLMLLVPQSEIRCTSCTRFMHRCASLLCDCVVTSADSSQFHIELESYLHGICKLPSELTRLATNSVTQGDFTRAVEVSQFVSELHDGFKLLNLKNGKLRPKFDGIKYEVKKAESIVYDLSIRGLLKK